VYIPVNAAPLVAEYVERYYVPAHRDAAAALATARAA
jgi:hypothetical protein